MFDQRPRHARALDTWCQVTSAAGPLFLAGLILAALLVSR